jgi:hypothetical protein
LGKPPGCEDPGAIGFPVKTTKVLKKFVEVIKGSAVALLLGILCGPFGKVVINPCRIYLLV